MSIVLNGTTGITTPDITSTTSTLGSLTQALDLGSTGQIVFPTTQNASANANTLDDYEEGTWAPVLTDESGNAFGMSGATVGTYTKIGNLVTVIAYSSTTGIGSASGDVRLTGLPFTVENSDARGAVTVGNASSMSLGTPGFSVTGLVVGGTTYIYFYIWNATSGTASRLSTTTHTTVAVMYMSCTYRV